MPVKPPPKPTRIDPNAIAGWGIKPIPPRQKRTDIPQ